MKRLFTITMLLLAGNISFGQNFYGNMDTWRTYSAGTASNLESPQGWYSADSLIFAFGPLAGITPQQQVFKSNSSHAGAYAAEIKTKIQGGQAGTLTGILTNAQIGVDIPTLILTGDPYQAITYNGGTPVTQRIGGISAWVKYAPSGNDTAMMVVQAVMNNASAGNTDSVIGEGFVFITSASNWTQIYSNINYINNVDVPDTIIVAFMSSGGLVPQDNSTLYVDDVNYIPVGINDIDKGQNSVSLYPNPANNTIHLTSKQAGALTWEAYNVHGQKVAAKTFSENASVDVSFLSNGIYVYRVSDKNGTIVQRGKFNVAR